MKWWGYLIFAVVSFLLAVLNLFLVWINLYTDFLVGTTLPLVRYLVKLYDFQLSYAMLDPYLWTVFFYPLALAPLHWLNYKILRWNIWTYILMFLLSNFVIAFFVLLSYSQRPICYYGCPPVR